MMATLMVVPPLLSGLGYEPDLVAEMLHALNIDILCANKTLQDRLVKELRLQGINTIAAGNELLPGFLADYNARFGKEPRNPKNLHRTLLAGDDLTDVFAC